MSAFNKFDEIKSPTQAAALGRELPDPALTSVATKGDVLPDIF